MLIRMILFEVGCVVCVYLYPPISLHDVEHSILRVKLFVFGRQIGKDVIVCCPKWICVWLPFTLARYLLRFKWVKLKRSFPGNLNFGSVTQP